MVSVTHLSIGLVMLVSVTHLSIELVLLLVRLTSVLG